MSEINEENVRNSHITQNEGKTTGSPQQSPIQSVKPIVQTESKSKATFQEQFKAFSKFGDTKSDGKHITLSQSDKWMKQAKVFDKTLTTTDTGIHFKKFKALKISCSDYKKFLEDLSKTKNINLDEIKDKMTNCGPPGVTTSISAGKASSAVERLTDTSKYTGTHKERFDASGKGKGIAGRKNIVDQSGYVTGYHNKDTYETKH